MKTETTKGGEQFLFPFMAGRAVRKPPAKALQAALRAVYAIRSYDDVPGALGAIHRAGSAPARERLMGKFMDAVGKLGRSEEITS